MSAPKRIDAPDTVDLAVHALLKLQAEGWGVTSMATEIDYGKPHKHGASLPVRAEVTVVLVPALR